MREVKHLKHIKIDVSSCLVSLGRPRTCDVDRWDVEPGLMARIRYPLSRAQRIDAEERDDAVDEKDTATLGCKSDASN